MIKNALNYTKFNNQTAPSAINYRLQKDEEQNETVSFSTSQNRYNKTKGVWSINPNALGRYGQFHSVMGRYGHSNKFVYITIII